MINQNQLVLEIRDKDTIEQGNYKPGAHSRHGRK